MPSLTFPADDSPDPDEERAADARLTEFIREVGRCSPEFRYLREELISSGLGALLRMGPWRALEEARRRGLYIPKPVPPSYAGEYPSLCYFAVRTSIDGFMRRQILGGGWRPEGGASLRGYFRTRALYAFVDQYRTYHAQEAARHASLDQRRTDGDDPESDGCQGALVRPPEDPEQIAIRNDSIRRKLADADDRLRQIFALYSAGYTHKEIGEALGMTDEAVSSALRRFRRPPGGDDPA